ncbi:MAG: SRPBCC family protein [Chitinophagaceae bacterium]
MANTLSNTRKDFVSRVIRASPQKIYKAFIDHLAIAVWRPPEGMKCEIYEFNPYEDGTYRMSFGYKDTNHDVSGKTSEHADVFQGRFLELVPGKRIVELIEFESDDPAFAGEMTITTSLTSLGGGTEVTFLCENVPTGIQPEDHYEGMTSSLKNLAEFTE